MDKDFYIVSEAFYDCAGDFDNFCKRAYHDFGVRETDLSTNSDKVLIITKEEAGRKIEYICTIIKITLILCYEKGELDIQGQWSRAIMSLLSNIKISDTRET